jgi:hypothetical protein
MDESILVTGRRIYRIEFLAELAGKRTHFGSLT